MGGCWPTRPADAISPTAYNDLVRLSGLMLLLLLGTIPSTGRCQADGADPAAEPVEEPAADPVAEATPEQLAEMAQEAYFRAIDLRDSGDTVGAITAFQEALDLDPTMHQARLHLAEAFHDLELDEEALEQLRIYVEADFPGAEIGRARLLIDACGGDPDAMLASINGDGGGGDPRILSSDDGPLRGWTRGAVEVGVHVGHFANDIGLTAGGPVLEGRVLPWRYLQIGARVWLGVGPFPGREGAVQVPCLGLTAAASIPVGAARFSAGALLPLVISRYDARTRVDSGLMVELGLRVPVEGSRLVLGVQIEAGHLVTAALGGSVRLGVLLGPRGGAP